MTLAGFAGGGFLESVHAIPQTVPFHSLLLLT